MPRPFWQVVEDPDYIEDWDEYMLDQENRERGVQIKQIQPTVKINGRQINFDVDKFID